MPPKRKASELVEPFFDDSGTILCQPQSDFLVTVGVNLAKSSKKPVRIRVGETPEEAVRRWLGENKEKADKLRSLHNSGEAERDMDTGDAEGVESDVHAGMFGSSESFLCDVESAVKPVRQRVAPDRYECDIVLRHQGSGQRRPAGSVGRCRREDCLAIAAERQWMESLISEAKGLWRKLAAIAEEAAEGDPEREAAVAALQQAMLDLYEGAHNGEAKEEDAPNAIDEGQRVDETEPPGICAFFSLPAKEFDSRAQGRLFLTEKKEELVWEYWDTSDGNSSAGLQSYSLSHASAASLKVVQINPFQRVTRLTVRLSDATSELQFVSSGDEEATSRFVDALNARVKEMAVEPSGKENPAAAAASSSESSNRVTNRVREGRELRQQLLEAMRLRNCHKAKEADALVEALEKETAAGAERAERTGLTRKRALQLRDEAFSYGGLQLTRDIVGRFLKMPEVRELLNKGHYGRHASAEVNEMIVTAAKDFIGTVFKANGRREGTGGRLGDEARNAHIAALATLLPRELFESRRGRAACRALGLSYRQAKRATIVRGELMDSSSGWKRIKTAEHFDKVDYRALLDEAWHSELLSTPDNQNKQRIRVDLGHDPKTGERLYDMHERRAQLASTRQLLTIFHASEYAGRLREATKTSKRRTGVKVSIRQFTEARCPCIKKRKPSQCDCEQCTFIEENLRKFNIARNGWHAAYKREHGHRCLCHLHRALVEHELAEADAERAWSNAGAAAGEDRADLGEAAQEALDIASSLGRKVARTQAYDSMFKSTAQLIDTLIPCGRTSFPEYTVSGAPVFRSYPKECASGNCPKKLWRPSDACSFHGLFRDGCPLERAAKRKYEWRVWEQRPRGTNKETGEVSYSTEFVPRFGTCSEFWDEYIAAIPKWIYHVWRDNFIKQGLRVHEDRKSGRHLAFAQEMAARAIGTPSEGARSEELRRATEMFNVLQRTATIQSDYAAQLEVGRSHTATCGRPEKHNLLVSIIGYKSYSQAVTESNRKARKDNQPSRRESSTELLMCRRRSSMAAPRVHKRPRLPEFVPRPEIPSPPLMSTDDGPRRPRVAYKQHCDYLFAFHDKVYKPNARSYNVVQEDIDYFLKFGAVLHGEWFIDKERVPLANGNHDAPLPDGLTERGRLAPDFPEMNRRHSIHDGCSSQFACGTEFHQTAEWRTKTAEWDREQGEGIVRDDVKLVEHHGKGPYDAAGNIPNNGVRASVRMGLAIQPGTRELVLHLAAHYPRPQVSKEGKEGWLSADRYIYCYYHPSKFTRFSVPESKGFDGSHSHHQFVGLCTDRMKAEKDGPLHSRKMFCACYACIMLKFDQCEMVAQVGPMRIQHCPLLASSQLRRPQMRSLQEFADDLCAGMVVATRVARDERGLEHGLPYWLALVLGHAFTAPTDMLHAGEEIQEGWLVVEIQFYELADPEKRAYKLNPTKRLLNVQTIVRMKGIEFERAASNPRGVSCGPNVSLRSGRGHNQQQRLSEDMHYAIMAGLGED